VTRRLTTAAVLAALAMLASPAARAGGFGRGLDELVRIARGAPAAPAAELAALEAFARWDEAPAEVRAALEAMSKLPGLGAGTRDRVRLLLAEADLREGRSGAAEATFGSMGFASSWRVLGPLDPDASATPIAELLDEGRDYDGARGQVRWRPVPASAVAWGRLDLAALFARHAGICAIAATDIDALRAKRAVLRLSAAGSLEATWNGEPAVRDERFRRSAVPDRLAAVVEVRQGSNRLVVRVCSDEGGAMALAARLTDETYAAWPAGKRVRDADAALYAYLTGALDDGSHAERDLARGACVSLKELRPCLVWGALAVDSNERRLAAVAALCADPASPEAAVALARLELEAGDPARALDALGARGATVAGLDAEIARAEILAARGLPLTALAALFGAAERFGGAPALWDAAMRLSEAASLEGDRLRAARELEVARFDLAGPHLALAKAAAARGDGAALDAEIGALNAVAAGDRGALLALADALADAGRGGAAGEALARAAALDPFDGEARKRLGLSALRAGRREEGLADLREARRLTPGDAWLAGYLDELSPVPQLEAPYVVAPREFLAQRGAATGDAAYLVDSQVVRVEESGLASRFTQLVVEIHSDRAAREFRTHSVEFAPATQRVKILAARVFRRDGAVENATGRATAAISEPWYRLYYDLEAELVELPPLEAGDVIEYRYRVDDVDAPAELNGYFGDFTYVSDALPKVLWRYVLLSPARMPLEIAAPEMRGLSRKRSVEGDRVAEVIEAERVEAVAEEPFAPGESAGRAYLHVSTFRTYEELGRWYAGLVRGQLTADARIREKARELARGRATAAEKAAAIYEWVVTATRYVGLEFGLHGYKPYRAAQVMSRGFGDCKDKATLLVALLREAGLPAEIALVRTRSRGEISRAPASLDVFNHAVAYVPELDLWLDGTAEHHGSRELPFEDQGVIALRIAPEGPILTRTPVAAAEQSALEERLRVSLDASGNARARASLELRGPAYAPAYRREFAAESNRKERFAAVLAERFPGSEVAAISIEGLEAPERPVRVSYEASISALGKSSEGRMSIAIDRGERLAQRYVTAAARRAPLEVGPRRVVARDAEIEVPPGFRVARLPDEARVETEFGSLTLSAAVDAKGVVRLSRRFVLDTYEVAPEAYAGFSAFCRAVDRALAAPVVLERVP
jgi:cellulose synthase operon protein C